MGVWGSWPQWVEGKALACRLPRLPIAPDRQPHRERRAAALVAFDGELATVTVDDVLDDGQSQPCAAGRPRAPLVHTVESLGQPRHLGTRDAGAVVADRQRHAAPRRPTLGGGSC